MEYEDFIDDVSDLDFIQDRDIADAAVKAVLGILASRVKESEAKKLTEDLPDPLTLERLRGHQRRVTPISAEQFVDEIGAQFSLNRDQARELVNTVLHTAKDAVAEETISELEEKLPSDWAGMVENA